MLNGPFSPWPAYSPEEIQAVAEVLASNRVNYWTGDLCRDFERRFAGWVGVPHAVALSNGTTALEACLHALKIGPGDEVITTPRTFVASASCVAMAGATPVFADVDADTQGLSADTIRAVTTPRTRAVICVHLGGVPCDMDPILALADQHGFKVIEDCAQAHGARYRGRNVGSIGHIAAWSFCQDKIMTTGGEGGMVTTDDPTLWDSVWSWKDHGKTWEAMYERDHPPGPRLVHDRLGTNARMIEMQAAIGLIQLDRMADWTARRTDNAGRILEACARWPALRVPSVAPDVIPAWYRAYAFVRRDRLAAGWSRDRIVDAIQARGVPCMVGTAPEVYLEQAFDAVGRPAQRLPIARQLGETGLCFLTHPTLTDDEVARTVAAIDAVMAEASDG
ncbi:MAG TPA: DegT/DnrJ/EryC1/StrS family aminotransferase [Brevundimonas sp.]|uniref:DegT/DnrJ/EryC1/StrS family aminotransferase n=1 Tax=Brevundimonas sp. TaxID=1871086 RepID=UPI0026343222|nr:DegT/DnrJ/EryC1/StrS family aminotransferase [Brevundimonas sp.]HRO33904.1 DegT/DnrJ/EryC1/StrS family aminotransferase [Brevundimonas sp.]